MAILPQAPLVEVIFEIRWNANNPVDLQKYQIVVGTLSAALTDRFELPSALLPIGNIPLQDMLGQVVYRSKHKENKNLLYQTGPGVVSVNYAGNQYDWDLFRPQIINVIDKFAQLYHFNDNTTLTMQLRYLDFFDKDPADDTMDFVKRYFHLDINADYIEHPQGLGFSCEEQKDAGIFRFALNRGQKDGRRDGFILESSIQNTIKANMLLETDDKERFLGILDNSHVFLSNFFKNITRGLLYESFKVKKGKKDEQ